MPTPTESTPASPEPRPKGKHGGARPGAGAPKGNLNALKHGRRSAQFAAIGALLAADPKIREALLTMASRKNMKQRKAQTVAATILAAVIDRANQIAGGRLDVDLPVHDWRIIKQAAAEITPPRHAAPPKTKKTTHRSTKIPTQPSELNQESGTKSP
jgi:hypothetical protein